jgi:diacylglycerol kinase (ATP)
MPRVVILRNPVARRALAPGRLEAACAPLRPEWDVEVRDTEADTRARGGARQAAADGADYILACGGDGTLSEVVNGVLEAARPEVVVGLVPAGTANVWAAEAGIPRDPVASVALLERGAVVSVDVGRVRAERADGAPPLDRHFVLMCSMGLDAAVVERVEARPSLKRWLRQGAFVAAGIPAFVRERPVRLAIDGEAAGEPVALLLAGNTRLYGGVARLASAARMDDGLLDLVTYRVRPGPPGLLDASAHLVRGAWQRRGVRPDAPPRRVDYRQAARVTVTPEADVAVQCDGEPVGRVAAGSTVTVEAVPGALRLLVPAAPNPLWGGALSRPAP